jgi:1-acyl-sn-glycerol-3-phosphate acyltransferase
MIMVRSAFFNVTFLVISLVLTIAATVVRFLAPSRVFDVAVLWARSQVLAVRIICGIRLEVSGLENIPPGAVLIASRHQSAFDTFVWLTLLPRCCYVLKDDLLRIPLFGSLITTMKMIPVNRDGGGGSIRTLLRDGDRAAQAQQQIVIFPEGTRSEPDSPGTLQPGVAALALRTGLPVIPVSTDSGRYWGRRAFRKKPGTIRIVIGRPLPPQPNRKAFIQALESALAAADLAVRSESMKD